MDAHCSEAVGTLLESETAHIVEIDLTQLVCLVAAVLLVLVLVIVAHPDLEWLLQREVAHCLFEGAHLLLCQLQQSLFH